MKERIYLIDYASVSDKDGNPLGHTHKVAKDTLELLQDEFDFVYVASKGYVEKMACENSICLPHYMDVVSKGGYISKVKRFLARARNLSVVQRKCSGLLWFIWAEPVLGKYIQRFTNKIITNILFCPEDFSGKLNELYLNIYKHSDLSFVNNEKLLRDVEKNVFYPDYYYDAEKYDKYRVAEKRNLVVCVGTMNEGKDIEGLVANAREWNYELIIKGKFYDKSLYTRLLQIKGNNTTIEDGVLSDSEYYNLISEAKYMVLPYKSDAYKSRTSGVMIESVFYNTVVIAPQTLLEYMNVSGIPYNDIEEISSIQFEDSLYAKYNLLYQNQVDTVYNKEYVKNTMLGAINKLAK